MTTTFVLIAILSFLFSPLPSAIAAEEAGARAKALAEAAQAAANAGSHNATANRTSLLAPAELAKIQAETARLWAETRRTLSEANLNEARRQQLLLDMERLRQRMQITQYEFERLLRADYEMQHEIDFITRQVNLVLPLTLGRANWKTWLGVENLMVKTGDADLILQVMFDIPVGALQASEFISNEFGGITEDFPGGNLGELYSFAQKNDYSFKKYGAAHRNIMKVLALVSKAAQLRISNLRDINQAIRLTIARID